MKCELVTDVVVSRFALFAEMAWLERRPELGHLCKAARQTGRLDAGIVRAALPGVSEPGAASLIEWCQRTGLCDGGGALTELGDDAAETDDVPLPEQGVYELWMATHPLFGGTRVLHAERRTPTRDGRLQDIEPLPERPQLGRPFRSVLDPTERMIVRALPRLDAGPPRAQPLPTAAHVTLRWEIDFSAGTNEWRLEGEIDGDRKMRSVRRYPERASIDAKRLFAGLAGDYLPPDSRWDPAREELLVPFESLRDAEREQESFAASFLLTDVEVPGKGRYREAHLDGVPLGPPSAQDAQAWAEARFGRRLDASEYRGRSDVYKLFSSVVQGTRLARHRPALPEHAQLIARFSKAQGVLWSLAAPVDLSPAPVSGEQLGRLPVGEEAAS